MEQLGMYQAILTDVFEKHTHLFKKNRPMEYVMEVDKPLTRQGKQIGATGNVYGKQISPYKVIYSEKATKFCEIFTLLLTGTT